MMSRFSDFVVCSASHYIWNSGVYIRFRTSLEVEIQFVNSSDRIAQSFNIATLE